MREVVDVVVLDLFAEPALAFYLNCHLKIELFMNYAFIAAYDVELFYCRTCGTACNLEAFFAVDEASMDVLEDGRK